jgi:hypothetical protein
MRSTDEERDAVLVQLLVGEGFGPAARLTDIPIGMSSEALHVILFCKAVPVRSRRNSSPHFLSGLGAPS